MVIGAQVVDPGTGLEVQQVTGTAAGEANQAGDLLAPVAVHGAHGLPTLTGQLRLGRSGGTVRHVLVQTGLAGRKDHGARMRRGRHGVGVQRLRRAPIL
jgi:hypothetical protein